jgi:hypothetical protein
MPAPLKNLDARGWWTSLWRSGIVPGLLFLLLAAYRRDYFFALMAIGMIITGVADYVDRRGGRLWWAFVGMGIILIAAGIYFGIRYDQLPNVFHDIFKP